MQKRLIGQIVKINLFNNNHTYGYEINHSNVAILRIMTTENLSISEITGFSRIFTVGVLDIGFATWEIIGKVNLNPRQRQRPLNFIQDSIDLSLQIIDDNDELYSASFEEVQGLERVSGWHNFTVEQRVHDYFTGKTNITVEFKRPKPPDAPHFSPKTPYMPILGTIKQIPLGDGTYVYARELENTFFAIYDSRTEDEIPPENVTKRPVLFTISVSLSARIGWQNVGFMPLKKNEHLLPKRYLRIGSKPTDFLIYDDPYDTNFGHQKGTIKDAKGLEPAVMWDNYHVENRLRAYYSGHPWDLGVI